MKYAPLSSMSHGKRAAAMIGHAVHLCADALGPERRYGNGASAGDLIECRLESLQRSAAPGRSDLAKHQPVGALYPQAIEPPPHLRSHRPVSATSPSAASVVPPIGKRVPTSVPEHMGMCLERQFLQSCQAVRCGRTQQS